jgi:hypothetical protein
MQASIGFPIFWSANHGGCNVSGTLEFDLVPAPGDRVSLANPANGEAMPHAGFSGHLRVESRLFVPGSPGRVVLTLEPILVDTEIKAEMLKQYFSRGFGFVAD